MKQMYITLYNTCNNEVTITKNNNKMEKLTKTPTKQQLNEWIAAENAANRIPQAISELAEATEALANQECDFTGWNITMCLSAIAGEFKRMNDLKEQELNK